MNQRILELAIDAGIVSAEYNGFDSTVLTKAQRKFAELIVRECIGVAVEQKQWVKNQQPTFNYDDDRWNRARIQQSERIIEKIREQFGVEE